MTLDGFRELAIRVLGVHPDRLVAFDLPGEAVAVVLVHVDPMDQDLRFRLGSSAIADLFRERIPASVRVDLRPIDDETFKVVDAVFRLGDLPAVRTLYTEMRGALP